MHNAIYPCIWFDNQAKAAAEFYLSVFEKSKITADTHLVVNFELAGQKFMGLNGGPTFSPNPSVSFFVVCETPAEIKQTWEKLLEGVSVLMPLDKYEWSDQYGWLQDKFGLNWQLSLGNLAEVGQKFTPTLMFTQQQAGKAEEAIGFYTSVFPDSAVVGILKYSEQDPDVTGTVKHAQFKLGNQVFMAMDSSLDHQFTFSEGISLVVNCQTQAEIDYFWGKLSEGGREDRCGWLKDQYGVSWQIVPANLGKLMSDPERAPRVTKAFMQMKKFDIAQLENA
jgi:predicted 3-demethylubiquinone-9 3-methyltransferase (glyoxalase superfamily)